MRVLYLFVSLQLIAMSSIAQLLTTNPGFPTDNSTVTVTVDCSKGNKGLLNYGGSVYVHTGVITSNSTSSSDWKYVKFAQNFNQPNAALQATSLGNNKYSFTISNVRSYYGVPAGETIKKIAILFRSGDGNTVQRNADGSDMYITVYDGSLAGKYALPPFQPTYVPIPEPINANVGDVFNIKYYSSAKTTLSVRMNGQLLDSLFNVDTITVSPTITASGNQQVIACITSTTGSIKTDTVNFYVAPAATIAPLPAGVADGLNYESGDTSVILVLRAPNKGRVTVLGDFNNWTEQTSYQMNKTPDGKFFWLRLTGLTPGVEYAYQYFVDGALKIADPYTQKILDPSNDQYIPATTYPNLKAYPSGKTTGIVSILQTREPVYNWQVTNFTKPNKHSLVVYELLMRDFVANHDWKTVKDTLGYLKTLGINAIEIMPFNEFEGNNSWGYNPDFYFAPDKYYGPKADLKAFVDECHKNGIAVIMDIALNHSFGSSPMVQLYFNSTAGVPDISNPWFNPYAKHAYNVGYDMNHESPDTKYYVDRITAFWLQEYKLDGFRFDLAKGFTQKQTCDATGGNCDVTAWSNYDSSRVKIWKQYYDSIQTYASNPYVILEHFAANNEETDLSNYGMMLWGNENYAFNQATMGYVSGSDFSQGLSTARGWSQANLVSYMESHDEERLMYNNLRNGNGAGTYGIKDFSTALKRNEMAAAFFLTMPGPKMIWQFGEMGYDFSINTCQDGSVNNNCRTDPKPIRWDYLQNASRQRLHDIYAALLKLRAHPLYAAAFASNRVDQSMAGTIKWMRVTTDTSNLLVVGNFDVTDGTATISFPTAGTWYDYLTGTTITASASQSITLKPGEYHLYLNRNIVNAVTTPVFDVSNGTAQLKTTVLNNPVQANTQVRIDLPASGKLSISLHDMLGRELGGVEAGFQPKGSYQATINQIAGGAFTNAAGIYFLEVRYNNQVQTVKLVK